MVTLQVPRGTTHLPSSQHQALHGLRWLENLQLFNQMDTSTQVQRFVHPTVTCGSRRAVRDVPMPGTLRCPLPSVPRYLCR